MKLTRHDVARMLDLSAVRHDSGPKAVQELVEVAKQYRCILTSSLPSQTPLLLELLADVPDVGVGGNVAFPAGGELPRIKVAQTREFVRLGVNEIDVMMDLGMFLAGNVQYVEDDLRGVIDAADGLPVKVILECHYLTDDQICRAGEMCARLGAAFIKTGTGWSPSGATLENIALIKRTVGDAIAIKASGGIRGLETLVEMYRRGATRFGIGLGREEQIFDRLDELGGEVEFD